MTQVADIHDTVQLRILSQVKESKSKGETKRSLTLSMPQKLKSPQQRDPASPQCNCLRAIGLYKCQRYWTQMKETSEMCS